MKNLLKPMFAAVLAGAIALGTTACSGGASASSAAPSSAASSSASSQAASPVTITFWHAMSGGTETELKALTDKFNSENGKGITVKLVAQGAYADLSKKLMASASAKALPDMAQVYNDWLQNYLSSVVPLDDMIQKDFDNYDDIEEPYRKECTELGKTYTLPFNKSSQVLFYNKTEFDKLSMTPPATWDELAADCGKITKATGKPAMGYDDPYAMFQQFDQQDGGTFISDGKVQFTDATGVEAYKFISDLYAKGYARLAGEDKYMSTPFNSQNVFMYVGSSAGASYLKPNGFTYSAAPLPKGKNGSVPQAGTNLAMFAQDSAKQSAVWDYMKFLTSTESTAEWAMKTGYLPVRKSAFQSQTYQDFMKKDATAKAAYDQTDDQYFEATFKGSDEVRTTLTNEIESAILKKTPADQAVKDFGSKVQAILDKNK